MLDSNACALGANSNEVHPPSNVLGRTRRLDSLCDDFEDPNWHYGGGLWRGGNPSGRGTPDVINRVTPPPGGISGSTGALEIRTSQIDNDELPDQEDFVTAEYTPRLGRKLTAADQPVFMVRVWLPPFVRWGDYYRFGFRIEYFLENGSKTYSSIFFERDARVGPKPFVIIRIDKHEWKDWLVERGGWWTLAVAFDEKSFGRFYVHPGTDIPSQRDKIFDGLHAEGRESDAIEYINYSFISLMYPPSGNTSPPFTIDDYEVLVVEPSIKR